MAAANVQVSSEYPIDEKPTYKKMISTAIAQLAKKDGSSRQAIKKYLHDKFSVPGSSDHHINFAIKKGVASEEFTQPKGPSGPVKLSAKGREILLGENKRSKKAKVQPKFQPTEAATIAKDKEIVTPEVSIPKRSLRDETSKVREVKEKQGIMSQSKSTKMKEELQKGSEEDVTGKKRKSRKGQTKLRKRRTGNILDKESSEAKPGRVPNEGDDSKAEKARQGKSRPQKNLSASKAEESSKKSDSEATETKEELSGESEEDVSAKEKGVRQTRSRSHKNLLASKTDKSTELGPKQSNGSSSEGNEAKDAPKKRHNKRLVKSSKEEKPVNPKSIDVKPKSNGKGKMQGNPEIVLPMENKVNAAADSGEKQQDVRGNGNDVAKGKKRLNKRKV